MGDRPDPTADLNTPDEARPAKRVRLDAPLAVTEETQQQAMDEDDWADIYGEAGDTGGVPRAVKDDSIQVSSEGLTSTAPSAPYEHQHGVDVMDEDVTEQPMDGIPVEAIGEGDELVAPPLQPSPENNDKESVRVMQETTQAEYQPMPLNDSVNKTSVDSEAQSLAKSEVTVNSAMHTGSMDLTMVDANPTAVHHKSTEDPEFMAAAAAQKSNKEAEWQFNSSDAESSDSDSSDTSDSSDDSDSGSEDGYQMLDPATAAKILMSGDGDDDDGEKGKGKNGTDHHPRTANEVKEEVVKPDIVITPEMKITLLGHVESIVENMILIKGATPGEYQVLEGGSVLCNEQRQVVGAIADTFGRVQEPLYSVAFNTAQDIEEAGLKIGSQVFYVDSHSTSVFTQPLRNMKGTDASNIHDEEVGEDEIEFSDDEAEAEYKRQKKLAKKAGRGGLSRSAFQNGVRSVGAPGYERGETFRNGSDAPTQTYGGGMSYDDDETPAEDLYQPLKRPDNLSLLMTGGGPPSRPHQSSFERGRGRGRGDRGRGDRGKGRGDRGRGRGGFDNRVQRGGRGGPNFQQHDRPHRGSAHSFPDRHNSHSDRELQHSLPPKPQVPQGVSEAPLTQQNPQYQPQGPQTYQFNGYTFKYGNQPPAPAPAPAPVPSPSQYNNYYGAQSPPQHAAGSMPAGAYINPAFFSPQTQQQQTYGSWNGQYQHQQQQQQQPQQQVPAHMAPAAPPQQATPPANLDLSSILKQLGAPPS